MKYSKFRCARQIDASNTDLKLQKRLGQIQYMCRFKRCHPLLNLPSTIITAAVAQWLERSPREREVVGLIPDRVIPKTF